MTRAYTLSEVLVRGRGTERPFLCPVHGDSRPSASVNMIKKKWYCYTCGAHGGLTGDALLMEPDYEAMARHLEDQMEAEGRTYSESWLNVFDAGPVHPYWLDRFDEATARNFRLGYDVDTESVTYPLRDQQGSVLGVVRRPLVTLDRKYNYPSGVDISRYLFNFTPGARRVIVLVEGAMDAIACAMSGIEAWAIYGSRLSKAQVALIDRADPMFIWTAFDADDAGWSAHQQVERAFPHRAVVRATWPRSWGKDVDEIGDENRRKVFSDLLNVDSECGVVSASCRSHQQTSTKYPTTSSSTSKPGTMRIVRKSA
jgi:DNA primase